MEKIANHSKKNIISIRTYLKMLRKRTKRMESDDSPSTLTFSHQKERERESEIYEDGDDDSEVKG